MIVGASVAVTGTIVPQVSETWLIDGKNLNWLRDFILKIKEINGIKFYGISMASASCSYVVVSLLTFKEKSVTILPLTLILPEEINSSHFLLDPKPHFAKYLLILI